MAFEDFLRSIPLVHKHIMRTRLLIHENRQFRKFLETNGLKSEDVLSGKTQTLDVRTEEDKNDLVPNEQTIQTMVDSLRAEQIRSGNLETDLYVLQIDYDDLLKRYKSGKLDD